MASEDPHKKRLARFDLTYFIAMAFAVLIIQDIWVGQSHMKTIPYSEFRGLIDQNAVTDLVIGPTTITGAYKAVGKSGQQQHFSTVRVDAGLAGELQRRGIKYSGEPPPGLLQSVISWVLPTGAVRADVDVRAAADDVGRSGRSDEHRTQQGEDLFRAERQGHTRGRGGCRRSKG